MAAPTSGKVVQFYPERGGQLADLNAIQAITPLQATIRTVGPLFKCTLYVTPAKGTPYIKKNVPYFDSEYQSRPYTNIIPGQGGYCVDPTDAPAFPPPKTVPYQKAGWNMPLSPTHVPANPEDSAQPYVPVKIMEYDAQPASNLPQGTAPLVVVASDPQ